MLHHYDVKAAERTALILSMLPAIAPVCLKNMRTGYLFPVLPKEAGLKRHEANMLPTGTTVFFLIEEPTWCCAPNYSVV